jgi:hypothetical protein
MTFDLGGNSAAVTCPNNGTGLSTSIVAMGFNPGSGAMSNVEIRNGTIGPLYVRSSGDVGTDGGGSTAIYQYGGSSIYYHNLTIHDTEFAINNQIGGTTSGDQISFITITNAAEGIWYACGGSPCTSTGALIHDNNYTPALNWGSTANAFHAELLHIYSNGSGTSVNGALVYNNTCQPGSGWPYTSGTMNGTACLFAEAAVSSGGTTQGYMFNNLIVFDGSGHFPGDGGILVGNAPGNNWGLYNNTIDCQSNTNGEGQGIEVDGGTGEVYDLRNNIIMNCNTAIMNESNGGTYTGGTNIYYNTGGGGWVWQGNVESSLSAWQAASGIDGGSSTSNPGLTPDYTISSSSSVAHTLGGDNLTSLNVTALDTGAPETFGASGACGTGCLARAASGAWDIGAYPASPVPAPNPPTNLTATPH